MYACILETGRGFFEGVCAPCNATAHFRDPPPLLDSRIASPEAFHPDAHVAITRSRCLPSLRGRFRAQPKRGVGWMHRLPHDPYEFVVQRFEVRLVPERGGEGFQG